MPHPNAKDPNPTSPVITTWDKVSTNQRSDATSGSEAEDEQPIYFRTSNSSSSGGGGRPSSLEANRSNPLPPDVVQIPNLLSHSGRSDPNPGGGGPSEPKPYPTPSSTQAESSGELDEQLVGFLPRSAGGSGGAMQHRTRDLQNGGLTSYEVGDETESLQNEIDLMTRSYHGGDEDQGYEALVRSRSSSSSVRTASIAARERRTAYWRSAVVNLLLIASWYMFSTLISVYNKWMFSKGHYNFSYPLFVTSCHMVMQFGLSSIALSLCDRKLIPRRHNGTRARPSGYDWISKVVPCGLATALDIGLSNSSLKTITLSFYTMCKSSNLAFVLFFAFLFRLEVVRISLIGIIGLITAGVVMMVASETKFELVGAIQVLTASAMGGLRWALTQMLLDRDNLGMNNPIATIFWLAPVMALSLCTFSLVFESWSEIFRGPFFHGLTRSIKTMGLIAAPGVLAFGMNLSEFALIQRTSVVTLSVAGIFKEVLTISLASVIFGDELTPINITGLCITLLGIALYNWLKYRLITKGVNVVSRSGGSTTTTSGAGGHSTLGYTPLSNQDGEEEEGRRGNLQEEEVGQEGSSAILLGLSGGNKGQEVSEEEKERRRKREEEADLDGWERSGSKVTGNGWVDGSESD